jgi:hypothetical protein
MATNRRVSAKHRSDKTIRSTNWTLESLENRVVLSVNGSSGLLGGLANVGVVTAPLVASTQPSAPFGRNPLYTKLSADEQALANELQSLATKSGLTIADLESLATDRQSIGQSGFHFNNQTLNPVITELANAVAAGTSTAQAETDFTALFAGSQVSSTVINTTFADLVKAIKDSGVTTTDLSTVATDKSAIQTDLSNLPRHFQPLAGGFLAFQAGPGGSVSLGVSAINLPPVVVSAAAIPVTFTGDTSLLSGLSVAGVVTSPVVTGLTPSAVGTNASAFAKLKTDMATLRSELQTLATKSGVTIADLEKLTLDEQSIAQAGFWLNPATLDPVISELATAIAGGTSTAQAQTDFTNLFHGSSVSSTVINTTFGDLEKAISDSNVNSFDVGTVASDRAAISADLQNLHKKTPVPPVINRHHRPVFHPVVHLPKLPRLRSERLHGRR